MPQGGGPTHVASASAAPDPGFSALPWAYVRDTAGRAISPRAVIAFVIGVAGAKMLGFLVISTATASCIGKLCFGKLAAELLAF